MWEEDWLRLREQNNLKMVDFSEGRGPVDKHRMVLVTSPNPISSDAKQKTEWNLRDRNDSD
jgi:hypothetical protein